MVEQPAFASGRTALFDFAPEPFVVVHGVREQVQGDLIHRASGLLSQPGQLGLEFWWNLEIHEASVGRIQGAVNLFAVNYPLSRGTAELGPCFPDVPAKSLYG